MKKKKIFICKGSDFFCKSDINMIKNYPIIIKRTSAIKSYIRSYKRSNYNHNTVKKKIEYMKRMKYEFKRFYIHDLPKLNKFIQNLEIDVKN